MIDVGFCIDNPEFSGVVRDVPFSSTSLAALVAVVISKAIFQATPLAFYDLKLPALTFRKKSSSRGAGMI